MTSSNQTLPIVKKTATIFYAVVCQEPNPKNEAKNNKLLWRISTTIYDAWYNFLFSLVFYASKTCCSSNNVDERYENETYKIYSRTLPCVHTHTLRLLQIKMRITYNNKKCGIPCSSKLGKHIFFEI